MKITKRQLRRIIKEEKAKLLVEMNPIANAERSLSMYADESEVDTLASTVQNILAGVEMAAKALLLAIANALQAVGLTKEYDAVYRMVSS